jgi:hypothetical protein
LIETVRILSQVNERDGNVVFFDDRHLSMIEDYCESSEPWQTTLKGFTGTRNLCKYISHKPLWAVLNSLEYDQLVLYRSDTDLCQIINFLNSNHARLQKDKIINACRAIRNVQMTKPGSLVSAAMMEWLFKIEQFSLRTQNAEDNKVLSTIIGLIPYLVGPAEFEKHFAQKLVRFLSHADSRIVANTVDVLSKFNYKANSEISWLKNHNSNRVVANALLYFGKQELDRDVVNRLKKMIQSEKPDAVASALRVMAELTEYHLDRDPASFRMQIEFWDLFEKVRSLTDSENSKIQANAKRAVSIADRTAPNLKKAG